MTADTQPRGKDGTGEATLWLLNLVPPLIVLLHLQVHYMLVPHQCSAGSSATGHLVYALAIAGVAGVALIGVQRWRAGRPADVTVSRTRTGRVTFLLTSGLLVSIMAMLTLSAQWIPLFFVPPCS